MILTSVFVHQVIIRFLDTALSHLRLLSFLGKIDILINNAAVNPTYGPMLDTPGSAWDKVFDVNLKAPFLMVCIRVLVCVWVCLCFISCRESACLRVILVVKMYLPFSVLPHQSNLHICLFLRAPR